MRPSLRNAGAIQCKQYKATIMAGLSQLLHARQLAQTGHCVCKYMQLEHEHVEAVERYWLFCFVVALSSATDVRPQCSAALREPAPM